MTRPLSLALVTMALAAVATPALTPDDASGAAFDKKWAEKSKLFAAQKEQAKAGVLAAFDAALGKVDGQKGLTAAAKTDRRNELQAARKTFAESGAFPADDDFVASQFDYALKVNKAATPLTVLIDEVIDKGAKAKDAEAEKRGLKMKADLETQLGGASRFVGGTAWHGELRRAGGDTIPYHLNVGKMGEGGLFKAHVEDNPGVAGNWAYNVEGQTRALGVEYKMTKLVRGKFSSVSVLGIVSGDRLIAQVVQTVGTGKPAKALVVLTRVK